MAFSARTSKRALSRLIVLLACLGASDTVDLLAQFRGRGGRGTATAGQGQRGRGRAATATAARIEQRSYLFPDTNEPMEYSVFISSKVDRSKKSPLIIALHGLGVAPRDWLPQITDHAQDGGYIVAAPMGYRLTGGYGANGPGGRAIPNLGTLSERDVMYVLAIMRKDFNIDDRRIYLLGQSMGGAGALFLGIKHRDIWAAVGVAAPAINAQVRSPTELEQARTVPFVMIHGDADNAVPIEETRRWAAKMKALRMTYEFHELRGVGHGALRPGGHHIFRFFARHTRPQAETRASGGMTSEAGPRQR